MTQRFATVGAMMFLPVILNVFVITHAIDFGMGTPIITTLMLLATIFLLMWDYKKWMILFRQDHHIKLDMTTEPEDKFMTDPLWIITGVIFIVLTMVPWIFNNQSVFLTWIIAMLVVGITALALQLWKHRFIRKQRKVY